MVHNVALYHCSGAQHRLHKPKHTNGQTDGCYQIYHLPTMQSIIRSNEDAWYLLSSSTNSSHTHFHGNLSWIESIHVHHGNQGFHLCALDWAHNLSARNKSSTSWEQSFWADFHAWMHSSRSHHTRDKSPVINPMLFCVLSNHIRPPLPFT